MSDMHPITKAEKDILFDGFSKDEKGRSKYLRMRKKFDPEEKYRYPQLSSWEYGWNFKHITTPGKTQYTNQNGVVTIKHYFGLNNQIVPCSTNLTKFLLQVLRLSTPGTASLLSHSIDQHVFNILLTLKACEKLVLGHADPLKSNQFQNAFLVLVMFTFCIFTCG